MTTGAQEKFPGKFFDYGGAVLNVKHLDFGAKGDGVTDDTAAIQSAIDLASVFSEAANQTQGFTVLLPPGTYLITDTLTFTVPILFTGTYTDWHRGPNVPPRAGALLKSGITNSSKDVIEVSGVDLGLGILDNLHPRFEHFAIIGTGSERDGIRVTATGAVRAMQLIDLQIWNVGGTGVLVTNANANFEQCLFQHVVVSSVGGDGFFLSTGFANGDVIGNRFVECRASSCGRHGFFADDFKHFELTSFVEDSSGSNGIRFNEVRHARIIGAVTETAGTEGIYLDDSHNNTFIGGLNSRSVGDQINLVDSRSNIFIGVHLDQVASENHVSFDATSHDNIFESTSYADTPQISDSGSNNMFLFDHIVGTSTAQDRTILMTGGNSIIFGTPGERVRFTAEGLDVRRDAASSNIISSVAGSGNPGYIGRRSGGTHASPTNVASAQAMMSLLASGYSGSTMFTTGQIRCAVDGTVVNTQRPASRWEFLTNIVNAAAVVGMTLDRNGDLNLVNRLINSTVTALANDATPSVSAGSLFKTGGTTTITDLDDGVVGQTIKILSEHAITITDGTNILLNGSANFVMAAGDVLVLTMYNDQVWVEDSRQVN